MTKILKDDLNYVLFTELYHRFREPKAMRKGFAILEAALSAYAKKGWERVTLEMVAREAGISRSTLMHYFESAKELRLFAIKYVRLLFQKVAIGAISKEKHPVAMLDAYVLSCFGWTDQARAHALVWLSFLHACSHNKTDRELNTEAVQIGTERIASLLQAGKAAGVFNCANPQSAAKALQTLLTGGMISYASENFADGGKEYVENIRFYCHLIAGATGAASLAAR